MGRRNKAEKLIRRLLKLSKRKMMVAWKNDDGENREEWMTVTQAVDKKLMGF